MKKTIIYPLVSLATLIVHANQFSLPVPAGTVKDAYVYYKNGQTITVSSGYGECSGYYWEIPQDTDVSLTVPSGEDVLYIYLDHSESNYPNVVLIDSLQEPSWSGSQLGFYNGYDRCLGAVYTKAGNSSIVNFVTVEETTIINENIYLEQASNPVAQWTDTAKDADVVVPVLATKICLDFRSFFDGWTGFARSTIRSVANPNHVVGAESQGISVWNGQWLFTGLQDHSIQHYGQGKDGSLDIRVRGWSIKR